MAAQWAHEGIIVHVVTGVHPYRRASGSFRRLFLETGIWPNQYGSVYAKRLVWMQQNWPQYGKGTQWGEPWLTIIVKVSQLDEAVQVIKATHDGMRQWHFDGDWTHISQPYSIIAWVRDNPEFDTWAEPRRLRQHHGDTMVIDGEIVRRTADNKAMWTGDFRIWHGGDAKAALRENAHYWAVVETMGDLDSLLTHWSNLRPQEYSNIPPKVIHERMM
jgi:hypothetical protein